MNIKDKIASVCCDGEEAIMPIGEDWVITKYTNCYYIMHAGCPRPNPLESVVETGKGEINESNQPVEIGRCGRCNTRAPRAAMIALNLLYHGNKPEDDDKYLYGN